MPQSRDTSGAPAVRVGAGGVAAANAEDQLCEYGGFTYSYNARGQLQSKSDGMVTTSYSYDGLGRLLGVTEPGMDIHYVLDALGRRIGKLRDGNFEKGWLYADALNPIAELDQNGNTKATFIYGTRAHVPDAMVVADGTVYRFITDHLGSVRLVVNAETGEVVQRIDYDAFGRLLNDTNPGFQPFGFAGGLYDDDTGLVRFGARDYDADTGRWAAKDPVLFGGRQENLYVYVANDPMNRFDPTGLGSVTNHSGETIWVTDEFGGVVPVPDGRTHDNADGVFNTGFAEAGDNLFRKFNNWTDVTIRSGENGLFFEYDAWDDAVQDLDWRTGWKDDEWYYDNFRDRPPLCEP